MDQLTEASYELTAAEYEKSLDQANIVMLLTYLFLALMLLFLIASGGFLSKNIMDTLGVEPHEAAAVATNLARGNLKFELGKTRATGLYLDMKQMVQNLGRIIRETLQVSDNLASASKQFLSLIHI